MDRVKQFAARLLANPVFWIAVVLGALVGFINFFEQYAHVGVNSVYNLF